MSFKKKEQNTVVKTSTANIDRSYCNELPFLFTFLLREVLVSGLRNVINTLLLAEIIGNYDLLLISLFR